MAMYNKLQIISVTGKETKIIVTRLSTVYYWNKKLTMIIYNKDQNYDKWLCVINIIKVYLKGTEHFFVTSTGIPFRKLCMLHPSPVCIFNTQDYVGPLSILYTALFLL